MVTALIDDLFPEVRNPEGTCVINHRCLLSIQGERCLVIVSGVVIAQYQFGDAMAEAYAMVTLVEQGWADQIDVARVFGRSTRSVRRYQQRFEAGGLAALNQPRGYPKGRQRLATSRTELIHLRNFLRGPNASRLVQPKRGFALIKATARCEPKTVRF